ncbi:MAG: hypothetical protein H6700_02160 [Myxococcales bacterium]|nr:hypothetical protein [Myxococcales bacterium]
MGIRLQMLRQQPRLAAAGAAYALASLISIAWGLSYDLRSKSAIEAQIQIGTTEEGRIYLTVRNYGRADWDDVTVIVDGRYFRRFDRVAAGSQADAPISQFANADQIPRIGGIFFWEQVATTPSPGPPGPRQRPSVVTVRTRQGETTATLGQ